MEVSTPGFLHALAEAGIVQSRNVVEAQFIQGDTEVGKVRAGKEDSFIELLGLAISQLSFHQPKGNTEGEVHYFHEVVTTIPFFGDFTISRQDIGRNPDGFSAAIDALTQDLP